MHGAVAQRITANAHQERSERGLYTTQVFFFFPVQKKQDMKHENTVFSFSFFVTTVYDIYVHKHFSYPRNKRRKINY